MVDRKDLIEQYQASLCDLNQNSKPMIQMLSILAEESKIVAEDIVKLIEKRLYDVSNDQKLIFLYLMDSICKNYGEEYKKLFSKNLVQNFCYVFKEGDEKIRASLYKLRQTWKEIFDQLKLYEIDIKVKELDPAWPITANLNNEISNNPVHINPKFLIDSKVSSLNDKDELKIINLKKNYVDNLECPSIESSNKAKLELERINKKRFLNRRSPSPLDRKRKSPSIWLKNPSLEIVNNLNKPIDNSIKSSNQLNRPLDKLIKNSNKLNQPIKENSNEIYHQILSQNKNNFNNSSVIPGLGQTNNVPIVPVINILPAIQASVPQIPPILNHHLDNMPGLTHNHETHSSLNITDSFHNLINKTSFQNKNSIPGLDNVNDPVNSILPHQLGTLNSSHFDLKTNNSDTHLSKDIDYRMKDFSNNCNNLNQHSNLTALNEMEKSNLLKLIDNPLFNFRHVLPQPTSNFQTTFESQPEELKLQVDGKIRKLFYLDDHTAIVLMNCLIDLSFEKLKHIPPLELDPRLISFDGQPTNVYIDEKDAILLSFNNQWKSFYHNGIEQRIKFGGPAREVYLNNQIIQAKFGGPGVPCKLLGDLVDHQIRLDIPAPKVKLSDQTRIDLWLALIKKYSVGDSVKTFPMLTPTIQQTIPQQITQSLSQILPPVINPAITQPIVSHVAPIISNNNSNSLINVPSYSNNILGNSITDLHKNKEDELKIDDNYKKIKKDDEVKEPSLEFNPDSFKIKRSSLIDSLYSGSQCTNCSLRFDTKSEKGKIKYSAHLDWHFRQNRRGKNKVSNLKRAWYLPENLWYKYKEINSEEDSNLPADFMENNFNNRIDEKQEEPPVPLIKANLDESLNICSICYEKFNQIWCDEEEEWRLENAVLNEDKYYHPSCLTDMINKSTEDDSHIKNDETILKLSESVLENYDLNENESLKNESFSFDNDKMEINIQEELIEQKVDNEFLNNKDVSSLNENNLIKVKEERIDDELEDKIELNEEIQTNKKINEQNNLEEKNDSDKKINLEEKNELDENNKLEENKEIEENEELKENKELIEDKKDGVDQPNNEFLVKKTVLNFCNEETDFNDNESIEENKNSNSETELKVEIIGLDFHKIEENLIDNPKETNDKEQTPIKKIEYVQPVNKKDSKPILLKLNLKESNLDLVNSNQRVNSPNLDNEVQNENSKSPDLKEESIDESMDMNYKKENVVFCGKEESALCSIM